MKLSVLIIVFHKIVPRKDKIRTGHKGEKYLLMYYKPISMLPFYTECV